MKNKSLIFLFLFFIQNCFTSDSILDPTFGGDGRVTTNFGSGTSAIINSIALDANQNIVVIGQFDTAYIVARYLPNGNLDTTFNGTGFDLNQFGVIKRSSLANDITIQNDNKIVFVGAIAAGGSNDFALARYLPNGTLDATFGTGGYQSTDLGGRDEANAVALNNDSIFAAGARRILFPSPISLNSAIAKYSQVDGSLDLTFNGTGFRVIDIDGTNNNLINDIVIQSDGKLIVVGDGSLSNPTPNPNYFVARLSAVDGSLDTTFNSPNGFINGNFGSVGRANAVALQDVNGVDKIIVVGTKQNMSGANPFVAAARYNLDGTIDTTFGTNGFMVYNIHGFGTDVAIQDDGKIVISVIEINQSIIQFGILRVNVNGSVDNTFAPNGFVEVNFPGYTVAAALSLAIQNDGKIVGVGAASTDPTSTTSDFALARLRAIPCTLPADLLTLAIRKKYIFSTTIRP